MLRQKMRSATVGDASQGECLVVETVYGLHIHEQILPTVMHTSASAQHDEAT